MVATTNKLFLNKKRRRCGLPKAGKTYAYISNDREDPSGFGDTPVWNFVCDMTYPLPEGFELAPVSMLLQSRGQYDLDGNEIFDIWDWIGESNYPNFLDWILEVSNLGFHQLMNPEHILKLSPESRYIAVHSRGAFKDPTQAYENWIQHPNYGSCFSTDPQMYDLHTNMKPGDKSHLGTCVKLMFSNIIGGSKPGPDRVTKVDSPSLTYSYDGYAPVGNEGEYQPAAFFSLPIGRMAQYLIYKDNHTNTHEKALEILKDLDGDMGNVTIVDLQ